MSKKSFWGGVISILLLAATLAFIYLTWSVLIPFVLGLVIAYLINPLVDRFVALGLRRDRIVIVFYALFLLSVLFVGFLLLPPLYREANAALIELPTYAARLNTLNDQIGTELSQFVHRYISRKAPPVVLPFRVDHLMEKLFLALPANAISFAHLGLWVFIIPFVAFFGLSQSKQWLDTLFNWTPSEYVESLLGLLAEVNATLGGYIRGQLLDAMCVGAMTMVGLWMLGFQQSVLVGLLVLVLNPIPFLAPLVGGAVTLLLAYLQGMPGTALFGIICLFVLVRLCDDFFFTPFIVGQSVRLHPVIMLFAILAGVEVGGIMGLVFAIPAAAVIKVAIGIVVSRRRDHMVLANHHIVS